VPIINNLVDRMGREKLLEMLKDFNAERVFLAIDCYTLNENDRKKTMEMLKINTEYFRANGFEVGCWLWTFMIEAPNSFTKMRSPLGIDSKNAMCPSDKAFRAFASDYLVDIADQGVDLIMFDDDFRYGYLDCGLACVCKNHIEYMESLLGESLEGKNLQQLLLCGKPNKYRAAWTEANGHFMRVFAKEIEEAVHTKHKNTRIGLCSCMTLWDFDGVDTAEISRTLAGDTKPFMRLIGAPYWAVNKNWGNRLQHVIENERMERSWVESDDIEIFSEGDAWPRPRNNCPSSYLEIFDTALRADGKLDGILKYGIDYFSNAGYEMGYLNNHKRHEKLYADIAKQFGSKAHVGIRIYEAKQKFNKLTISKRVEGSCNIQDYFFSPSARMLTDNSIPTVYEGLGVAGIACGENILFVDKSALKQGMILDLRAAEILKEQGVDVGLEAIGEELSVTREYNTYDNAMYRVAGYAKRITVSPKASVVSKYRLTANCELDYEDIVASYTYENSDGEKFYVLGFDAYFCNEMLYRSYGFSNRISYACKSFFGKKLPAYAYGNPDLYIMAKDGEGSRSVGLWNIFADTAYDVKVELDRPFTEVEFYNCEGRLDGSNVIIDKIIPYDIAFFTVK